MFVLTERQQEANRLLGSKAKHVLLYGGARSGKTFLIVRAMVTRALAAQKSRHVIMRHRFNHLRASIIADTLPKVLELCWPGVAQHCHMDKQDWFYRLPNGSEIWMGGLDDKERTEKILGQEYATVFLSECSQIGFSARNMALTRLAQNTRLRLKAFYDCNPPGDAHWTYRLFIKKVNPESRLPVSQVEDYASMRLNPGDNVANLPADYLRQLEDLPARMRQRFLAGEFQASIEGALWTMEGLDAVRAMTRLPDMQRVVIAVDPSGCHGEEDKRSDEVGIIVCGLGTDGHGYVIEDLSGRWAPGQWGQIIATAYDRHEADCVVGEINYGGAMVQEVIKAARPRTPFREVRASRGKAVRAEPISYLFEQRKVSIAGFLPNLEDQLCSFTTHGYEGDRSPDRADAMIWGLTELFPGLAKAEQRKNRPNFAETSYTILG